MKKLILAGLSMAFGFLPVVLSAQQMTWTTKSDAARDLALSGAHHLMNAEFAQSYDDFSQAVKLDPDFTVALTFMTGLSYGESKTAYRAKVQSSLEGKTEGEKLFASTVDPANNRKDNSETWAKLHAMFPDGSVIGYVYVMSRLTPEEQMNAAEEYMKNFPDEPAIYNYMAYTNLQVKKDTAAAKEFFEKYLALYPEGCNSYDSMGEFYLDTGDTANAKKYYGLALEKYPFNMSSIEALQKINHPDGK
jgi:tetratricopeptide (TPR) repeat protein